MNKIQITMLVAGLLACTSVAPGLLTGAVGGVTGTLGGVLPGVDTIASTLPGTTGGLSTAAKNILNNLPTTIVANIVRYGAVVKSLTKGTLTFDEIYEVLLTGVYIADGDDSSTTNSVGGLGLPTATLCKLGAHYEYTSCYICNEDCYVAHNLWGGGCHPSDITGQPTCYCAENAVDAAERGLTPNSTTTCAKYNPIAKVEAYAIALAFRARYIAIQCLVQLDGTYDSTGCNVDCVQNHGYKSGACQIQKPNVEMAPGVYLSGNDKPTAFCICSHTDSPDTTYALNDTETGYGSGLLNGVGYYGVQVPTSGY